MASFVYTARDNAGSAVSGSIEAENIAQVSQILRRDGKYPTSIKSAGSEQPGNMRPTGLRLKRADVIQLSTQLAIMMETGVTLLEALDCVAAQSTRKNVRALLDDLSTQVQGGTDFSTALSRHPRTFPRLYIAMIKASERSGMMARMMQRATVYLRDEQDILRRVKGALTYPAIMLAFAVSTTLFLLTFVLPRFTAIYASKRAALPLPTKMLMGASDLVIDHWPILLIGTGALLTALFFYLRTAGGLRVLHFVQLHVPLIGAMYRRLHLSRGLRMIGTMAGAGVGLLDCVNTALDLCANTYFRDMWDEISRKIQTGKQLSEPLFASPLVPRSVAQMIHSGEKSGKLAQVMEQIAGHAEQELKDTIVELTRYIEPAMIIIMGLIIGGVALALMLPVFTISRVMAQ
jgi:type II secretory pathway component PulF